MGRKGTGDIKPTVAFDNIYTFTKTRIPQPIEDKLLDTFTRYCDDHEVEDILLDCLPVLFVKYLHMSHKLTYFIKAEHFVLDGTSNIVDFEKFLFNGYLYLTLNRNLKIIDSYWSLVVSGPEKDRFKQKLYLNDIKKLAAVIGDTNEVSSDLLVDMLTVANNGEDKLYVDYFDFGTILGRIGELQGY